MILLRLFLFVISLCLVQRSFSAQHIAMSANHRKQLDEFIPSIQPSLAAEFKEPSIQSNSKPSLMFEPELNAPTPRLPEEEMHAPTPRTPIEDVPVTADEELHAPIPQLSEEEMHAPTPRTPIEDVPVTADEELHAPTPRESAGAGSEGGNNEKKDEVAGAMNIDEQIKAENRTAINSANYIFYTFVVLLGFMVVIYFFKKHVTGDLHSIASVQQRYEPVASTDHDEYFLSRNIELAHRPVS